MISSSPSIMAQLGLLRSQMTVKRKMFGVRPGEPWKSLSFSGWSTQSVSDPNRMGLVIPVRHPQFRHDLTLWKIL